MLYCINQTKHTKYIASMLCVKMNTQMLKQEWHQTSKHRASLLSIKYVVAVLRHKSGQLPTWEEKMLY